VTISVTKTPTVAVAHTVIYGGNLTT